MIEKFWCRVLGLKKDIFNAEGWYKMGNSMVRNTGQLEIGIEVFGKVRPLITIGKYKITHKPFQQQLWLKRPNSRICICYLEVNTWSVGSA